MKFAYKKIPIFPHSSYLGISVLRPIIPAIISYGGNSLKYDVLIDSGADFCILPAEIGEYLGIDIKSRTKQEFGGIQEQGKTRAVAYMHEVILNIGGYDYKTTVGFSYDIAKMGYGILGQKGFFNLFKIQFDYRKGEVELKEKPEVN
ncbi:hypothetical protein HYW54_03135 [Candidatus Gottesmanbacteria bacterium]|nr:hypothetical protein [Candidatus Gottesmanbacteria bacterium]